MGNKLYPLRGQYDKICWFIFNEGIILRPLTRLVIMQVDIMLSVITSYIYGRS